jgi:hypothetical protein
MPTGRVDRRAPHRPGSSRFDLNPDSHSGLAAHRSARSFERFGVLEGFGRG